MFYKNYIIIFIFFILFNCTTNNVTNKNPTLINKNLFSNKGFTLKYDNKLYQDGSISNKLEERDLIIFQQNLKINYKAFDCPNLIFEIISFKPVAFEPFIIR